MSTSAINPLFEFVVWAVDNSKQINAESILDLFYNAPQYYKFWWSRLLQESPAHIVIETSLIVFILWLMFVRRTVDPSKPGKNENLSNKEVEWLLETWTPDSLVPKLTEKERFIVDNIPIITGFKENGSLIVEGVSGTVLNVSAFDFLGLSRDPDVKGATIKALDYYGCGSCGPRGFYGTIDQHLFFEEAVAKFCGAEEAISYSDSASAVSSVIPAFSKKGDFLLVDEACWEAVQTGVNLSRSTIQFFRHNDVAHLTAIMESIAEDDRKLRRDPTQQRRFIVVEGLYRNVGDLCPLKDIVELKKKFCYRLILDESLSFGTIGASGRGVTEHFGVNINDVEVLTLSMDTSLASVGGVCIGEHEVVDHQRLSGAGYCFSAAAPPFLSAAAIVALQKMESHPSILSDLRHNAQQLFDGLSYVPGLQIKSTMATPIIHLQLLEPLTSLDAEAMVMLQIAKKCLHGGVGVSASKSIPSAKNRPSLVVCAKAEFSAADISKIVKVIAQAASSCV
jgi:serine palmitoyltransferase